MASSGRALMLRLLTTLCVLGVAAGNASSAGGLAGRWEGEARVPGSPLPIVLDLERAPSGAGWVGSLTLPGRRVKGAPLAGVTVDDQGRLGADAAGAFGGPPSTTATRLDLRLSSDDRLVGDWQQGGHRAAVVLRRSGEAQVDEPVPSTVPLPPLLSGTWRGRYELGGYAREVTLTFAGPAPLAAPFGSMRIVGKRRTDLPIERVQAGERYLTIETGGGIRIEGQWDAASGHFDGWMLQGPFEARLPLRRGEGSGS